MRVLAQNDVGANELRVLSKRSSETAARHLTELALCTAYLSTFIYSPALLVGCHTLTPPPVDFYILSLVVPQRRDAKYVDAAVFPLHAKFPGLGA